MDNTRNNMDYNKNNNKVVNGNNNNVLAIQNKQRQKILETI